MKGDRKYVATHSKGIVEQILSGKSKTEVAKSFGIAMICVDRALLMENHPELASNYSKKVYKSLGHEPTSFTPKGMISQPSFSDMMTFMVDVFAKAEKTTTLENKVKELEEKVSALTKTNNDLFQANSILKQAKSKWEALAYSKNNFVTHGD
jgi:hypothetical protein